jgi:hypothetical protein
MSQTKNLSVIAAGRDANDDGQDSPRAGTFHAQKNCDQYSGLAGGFCTLTVSTLKQIPVGTKVVYTDAATATALISGVTLVPPSPGNNAAFGHVDLNRVTRTGNVSFSGGTGDVPTLHRECRHHLPEPEKLGLGRDVQLQRRGRRGLGIAEAITGISVVAMRYEEWSSALPTNAGEVSCHCPFVAPRARVVARILVDPRRGLDWLAPRSRSRASTC